MSTTRTRVVRHIAADPASTALLLAAPTALELVPGVRHVGSAGDRALVDAELPVASRTTAATVSARPPQRTATSFVSRFRWTGPDLPDTRGTVRVTAAPPCPSSTGPATVVEIVLDSDGVEESGLDPDALEALARGFLDNLAAAAEQRNRAA